VMLHILELKGRSATELPFRRNSAANKEQI